MLTLALIGRPNVGKSTLFNRLVGKKLAIVNDTPGITRDWREAPANLFDLEFIAIDTAGLEDNFDNSIEGRMRQQTEAAMEHCNAALFIIDGRAGVTPLDEHFANWLRKQKKPVILAVNKAENERAAQNTIAEAYSLGLGDPIPISAEHSEGMEDLYHALRPHADNHENAHDTLGQDDEDYEWLDGDLDNLEGKTDFEIGQDEEDPEKPLKIAIVGRPNVGKSTLLNAIVNDQRVMTGPEAGITRDAVAVDWTYNDRPFRLVDTAGMRRRTKVQDEIEKMSVEDSIRAIRLAQIVILVLDANAALEKQDLQIAEHIIDEGRALLFALNKWDTAEDKPEIMADFEHKLSKSLAQVTDIPYIQISALKGKNINKLLDTVLKTYNVWNVRITTGGLNRWLSGMESQNPAPLVQGKQNRLKYITQIKTRPPTFALWVSRPDKLPASYKRFIINGLRKTYDIPGVPIRLLVRRSKNPYA